MNVNWKHIADRMIEQGINPKDIKEGNFNGFTNNLVDAMENLYGIETAVTQELRRRDDLEKLNHVLENK
jgi:hypothetical protein